MFRRPHFILRAAAAAVPACYGTNFRVGPRAWERIAEKNAEEGFANNARVLRLAIDSGGCHGYLYKFSFEDAATVVPEEDVLVTQTQVIGLETEAEAEAMQGTASLPPSVPPPAVVVDKISVTKLEGAVLDYHSELKGAAFVVVGNELVDQSCACALSFSLKKSNNKGGAAASASAAKPAASSASSASAAPSASTSATAQATPIQRKKRA